MKIHEYQGKEILKKYGVPVPRGGVVFSVGEAVTLAKELGGVVVVKAQIHAGGRGKGGGVKLAKDLDEVKKYAGQILGMQLVTHQTGPQGQKVRKLLVEEGCAIEKEFYLGATLDRVTSCITIMASREGGTEIEEVAAKSPEKILKMAIDPLKGVDRSQAKEMGTKLGLSHDLAGKFVDFVAKLYEAYTQSDCSLAEINPLVLTKGGSLVALDAKINFDDNALFRHPEFEGLRDLDEENPAETEARQHDLSYISRDGSIGCMVNGAGLAMATMDIIKLAGGQPANFLDVGGGASPEQIENAFRILSSDPSVQAVFINVFGGILRCDRLAEGVITAVKKLGLTMPVVVRMEGTNVELGKKMLAESGLNFASADDMGSGAATVVALARSAR